MALENELVETGAGSSMMVFRSRNAPMRRRDAATIRARERLIGGQNHSRTCDRGARATTCQTRALEVPKHEANRFFCPVADITANRQAPSFLLGASHAG